ncbi:MAG: efflux RND transporter periplasmic adaptor subunit [Alphaproteobacteria bacterium]|nr:efflux RND transporter periplasmic adaptor subunit [Alphaproteobacteria bacterium]
MPALLRKFGFAALVVVAVVLMGAVVIARDAFEAAKGPGGGPPGAAGGPAAGRGGPGGPGGEAPQVETTMAAEHRFSDAIQAIGTAQARESIVITPKVADTIRRLRFDSGDRVRAGQVLVEMANVEQQADLAEARAANEAAQQELARFRELFTQGFASQARIDQVEAAAQAAQARVDAGGSRNADRAIRAPFSGVMGLRTASPGAFVRPGDPISTLDDISSIKLDFDVPEVYLARLAPGVAITARTPAFSDVTFRGAIETVDSRVAPATRTVRVRAILPNRDERLRPGMLMTVAIEANPRDALAIPETAIIDRADGAYVFAVASRGDMLVVDERRVETGQRSGGYAEILGGVAAGDRVVVEGLQRVRPGQPVRIAAETSERAPDAASSQGRTR